MQVVAVEGTREKMGFDLGCRLKEAIMFNVNVRMREAKFLGMGSRQIEKGSGRYLKSLSAGVLELMEGLSRGCGIPFANILQYNYLHDVLCAEGCTSFAAVGKGVEHEGAVLMKNRDSSNKAANSPDFLGNRNINVIQILKYPDGNVTVGVQTAGSTGIVMGMNKHGVAAASNQGLTKEYRDMDKKGLVNYRGQFQQEGLAYPTAREAVQHVLKRLLEVKSDNPGILWFVDANDVYVLEISPREFAVEHITAGFTVRSNHFTMLDHLNDDSISCVCRYSRAKELMEGNMGGINGEKMMEFSMDHKNGPGENSICRHTRTPDGSVTESAAIMEINSKEPKKSRISIALGSPCRAWRSSEDRFTFQMDDDIGKIPAGFLDGSVFRKFIKQEPWEGEGSSG